MTNLIELIALAQGERGVEPPPLLGVRSVVSQLDNVAALAVGRA